MEPIPLGGEKPPPVGYVEEGGDIGKDGRGAAAKTLDELYFEAKEVIESPRGEHEKLYFKVDDRGMLLHCFKVDTRIADDPPTLGVIVSNLQLRPKNAESGPQE